MTKGNNSSRFKKNADDKKVELCHVYLNNYEDKISKNK